MSDEYRKLRGRTLGQPDQTLIAALCDPDPNVAADYLDGVKPATRTRNGADYLATFLLFAAAAGIERVLLSCDQLEDLASTNTTNAKRMLETERFRDVVLETWLGAKQRATSQAKLVLMGLRLYNPATGLFSGADPVSGGGANRYAYPTDPVNQTDLDGKGWFSKTKHWIKEHRGTIATVAATVGCVAPGVGWAACGVMQAAAYGVRAQQRASNGGGWRRTWRRNAADAFFTVAAFGIGRAFQAGFYSRYPRWGGARMKNPLNGGWKARAVTSGLKSTAGAIYNYGNRANRYVRRHWSRWRQLDF